MADGEVIYEVRSDDSKLDSDLNAAQKKAEQSAKKVASKSEEIEKDTGEVKKQVQEDVTAHNKKEGEKQVQDDDDAGQKKEESAKKHGSAIKNIASGVAKGIGAAMVAAGSAAVAAGTMAVNSAVSMDQAMNQFIASTGKGKEETERYQKVLEGIYKNNYGESFEDIAGAMEQVTKNLGDMDDAALQEVTESAFALRDTFEYDLAESTRAAKAMMDNFGTSGEAAMSLIAAGAQNGLDYSGELLDNISEYSVQFAKVGLDADDMFKIFQKGAETGAWNLDKIGDAVKEMAIRVIDGSDSTAEGFAAIGLSADEMSAKFAAGGESAKEAFQQTITALANMEDPLAQNTAGVNLFGTMWEDLGPEVVTQLANIEEGAYDTADAMNGIKAAKDDDLGSMFEGLKRSVEMLLLPLGNQLIPLLSELIEDALPVIEQVLPPLVDMIGQFMGQLKPVVDELLPILLDLFNDLMPPLMDLISAILPILMDLIETLVPPIAEIIEAILPVLIELVDALLPIIEMLMKLLDPILQLVMDLLGPILDLISEAIVPLIDALAPLIDILVNILMPVIELLGEYISDRLSDILGTVSDVIGRVIKIIGSVIDFIKNVFTGNWKAAWQNVKDIFKTIIEGMGNIFKLPINLIIDGINAFIRGLNKIKVPDWVPVVGGKGITLKEIPKLRVGMEYVPSDEFPALLHKGEAVLTAQENALYQSVGGFEGIMRALSQPTGNGDTYVTLCGGEGQQLDIDYDLLGDRVAYALDKAGLRIVVDKREFGRVVREVQK